MESVVTADFVKLRSIPSRFIISEPFLSLAYHGNNTELRFLLSKGINPNMTDKDGMGALHFASYNGNSQTTVILVESGANIDLQDSAGWTPLFWGVRTNQTRVAHLLLEAGCNVNILDNMNLTALDWACEGADKQIIKMLLDHGATANSTNSREKLSQIMQDSESPIEPTSVTTLVRDNNSFMAASTTLLLPGILENSIIQTGMELNLQVIDKSANTTFPRIKTSTETSITRQEDTTTLDEQLGTRPESISNTTSPNKSTVQPFSDTMDLVNLRIEQYEVTTPCMVPSRYPIHSPVKMDLNQWFESKLDNSHEEKEKIETTPEEDLRQQLVESESKRYKMASTIVDLESQLSRSQSLYQESHKQVQELNKLQSKLFQLNQDYESKIFYLESQLSDANNIKSNLHHDLLFAETQVRDLQRMTLDYYSQLESKEKALQLAESQRIEALTNLEKIEYERMEMKKSIENASGRSTSHLERKQRGGGDYSPGGGCGGGGSSQDTHNMLENYKNQVTATQDILLATQRQQIINQKRFEDTQRTLVTTQERLEYSQLKLADTLNQLQSLELQQLNIRKSYEDDAIETLQKLAETQATLSDTQQHFEDCQSHLADVKTQLAESRCYLLEKKQDLAEAKKDMLALSQQLEESHKRKDPNYIETEKDSLIIKLDSDLSLLKIDNQLLNAAIATKQSILIEYEEENKELTSKLTNATTDLSTAYDRLQESTSTLHERDLLVSSLKSQISELNQKVEWTLQQLAAQHQRVYNQITTHKTEYVTIESIKEDIKFPPSPGSPFPAPLFQVENTSKYFSPPDGYSTPRRDLYRPPPMLLDTANTMTTTASNLSPSSPIYLQENNDTPKLSPSTSISASLDTTTTTATTEIEVARQRLVHMEEELYTVNMKLLGSLEDNKQQSSHYKQLEVQHHELIKTLDTLNVKYTQNSSLLKESQDQIATLRSELFANNILLAERDKELLCSRKITMALRSKLKSIELTLQEEITKNNQLQSSGKVTDTSPVTMTSTSCNTEIAMNATVCSESLLDDKSKNFLVLLPSTDNSEELRNQLITTEQEISVLKLLLKSQEHKLSQAEQQVRDYKNYYVHCAAELKELKKEKAPSSKAKAPNSTGRSTSEHHSTDNSELANKLKMIMGTTNKSVLTTISNKENIAMQLATSSHTTASSGSAATSKTLRTPPPSVGLGCVWPEL